MKKHLQLGMNPSTASARLIKDLLFKLAITQGHVCYRCGKPLVRETFSVDHKVPWLDSDDPVGLYFDLENIAFSHLLCNFKVARRTNRKFHTPEERAEATRILDAGYKRRDYTPEKRKEKFQRTGH